MNKKTLGSSCILATALVLGSGCMQARNHQLDVRISSAEDMGAAARVRANEAYEKAAQALTAALEAQKSADAANRRASLSLEKK